MRCPAFHNFNFTFKFLIEFEALLMIMCVCLGVCVCVQGSENIKIPSVSREDDCVFNM